MLARVSDSAALEPFAYQVAKVALFGSMLGTVPLVSDVDIAAEVVPRFGGGDEVNRYVHQRIELAEQGGKRFRSMLASVVWPRMELTEYLRGSSRYICIYSFSELTMLKCPFRIVLEKQEGDLET